MKTHSNPTPGKTDSGYRQRRKGVALLTVLTVISLSTILVLTFFQLAQNEMVASDSYSNGLEAQQVAEQAVNMVIRQIRMATAGNESAWASQPGAIRVWSATGAFEGGFKLYSDDKMVMDNEQLFVDEDYADLTRWDRDPTRYVDLNEPVVRGDKVYYPIVDPTARIVPKWPKNLGDDINGVEGFFLFPYDQSNRGLIFDTQQRDVAPGPMKEAVNDAKPGDGIVREPLPMPAMWIYQLKDGTLGHIDSGQKFVPARSGSRPSDENPIVARFAFWADDETCKLNPNVHAGGASWATPMAGGDIDRNLGRFQPAQHEWQRYPGHPATTHIAPVLAPGIPDITYQRENMELIFGLVPRVVGGGSMSGTRKTNPDTPEEANGLIADKDRLYASLDEFLLEPGLKGLDADYREPNLFPDPENRFGGSKDAKQMQEHIERSKFFLSVVSRAPEVTLFNTPRISIWPTHFEAASGHTPRHHTVFDRLIRFCAEVGTAGNQNRHKYHFERYNADSSTADYDDIPRNQQLIKYLDEMTKTDVPGYGQSFEKKYGSYERHQIITEIFDYIRSVNLHDDSVFGESWREAFTPLSDNDDDHLTYTNGRTKSGRDRGVHKGHGQVTPIRLTIGSQATKGLGRFYTLSEMGVVVIACGEGGGPANAGAYHFGNPGMTEYQRGFIEDPSTKYKYSNIPPLPEGLDRNKFEPLNWPQWLIDMKDPGAPGVKGRLGADQEDLLDVAFDSKNWNWQLAWLADGYANSMPNSKYDRGLIDKAVSDEVHLKPDETCVQAALVWNMFCPSLGWVPINPDMLVDMQVEGMNFFASDGKKIPFGFKEDVDSALSNNPSDLAWASNRRQVTWHDRHYGGNKPFTYFLTAGSNLNGKGLPPKNEFFEAGGIVGIGQNGRVTPVDQGWDDSSLKQFDRYTWVTQPFRINDTDKLRMEEGKVTMKIYAAGTDTENRTEFSASQSVAQLVQTLEVPFPAFSKVQAPEIASGRPGYINEFGALQHGKTGPMEYWSLSRDGANPQVATRGRISKINGHHGGLFWGSDVVQSVAVRHGDFRVAAVQDEVLDTTASNFDDNLYHAHIKYGKQRMAHGFSTTPGWRYAGSEEPNWRKGRTPTRGDEERWLVHSPDSLFAYHRARVPFLMPFDESADVQILGDFDNGMGNSVDGPYINKPDEGNLHSLFKRTDPYATGLGLWELARDYGDFPYFVRDWIHEAGTPSYFSPNRIISSPGQFGSLPAGAVTSWQDKGGTSHMGRPWRTLQFRPNVKGDIYSEDHPGSGEYVEVSDTWKEIPDHLLLDLFWMPVVEPFAISEPLSTGGKVNLNYQILPYHHIKRNSAIRGVFKSEYMLCIPNSHTYDYKVGVGRGTGYHWRDRPYNGSLQLKSLRTVVLEDHTLYQFEKKFANKRIFKTASEICDIHLIPEEISKRMGFGGSRATIGTTDFSRIPPEEAVKQMEDGTYWGKHAAVGDNGRERPYSNIYARTTTKSNTFKVHYRAQVLKKAKGGKPEEWDSLVDQVVAEYRGSSVVERYVDPNDIEIPDYATTFGTAPPTIDKFYKYRVLNPTRFSP